MRILKANLTYRFYTSDGWTRQTVLDLMESPDIQTVIPRYYDFETDEKIMKQFNSFKIPESLNEELFEDCDYFSIYDPKQNFKADKIKENQIDYI